VEGATLGCSHPQVAAYLFGLWGLPSTIVEAIAWHHNPRESSASKFSAVAAVHAASAYHDEASSSRLCDHSAVNLDFLTEIGCAEREKLWRSKFCAQSSTGAAS